MSQPSMNCHVEGGAVVVPPRQRYGFALVRCRWDLDRVRAELADLLCILNGRAPFVETNSLLGIWVDAQGMANIPCTLEVGGAFADSRTLRIQETMGVSGIWMLCFLNTPDGPPSRADLLGALLKASGYEDEKSTLGQFVPIFGPDVVPGQMEEETRQLQSRYPGLLLAPLQHDPFIGRLIPHVEGGSGLNAMN